jgi:hypothetical protein
LVGRNPKDLWGKSYVGLKTKVKPRVVPDARGGIKGNLLTLKDMAKTVRMSSCGLLQKWEAGSN